VAFSYRLAWLCFLYVQYLKEPSILLYMAVPWKGGWLKLVAFLLFIGSTCNCISRVISRHSIRTVGLLPRKVTSFLWSIKHDLGIKAQGIYRGSTRSMAHRPDTTHGTSSCCPFNVSLSNLQPGLFLGYRKLWQRLQAPQFGVMVLF